MTAVNAEYALGRSPQEYARLARQAEIFRPMTRRLFEEAGITTGMRVLDLGSGAGDVCMLLAEMVGPSGTVIGLDVDAEACAHARERLAKARLGDIEFVACDFASYQPSAPVDAVVGRLVLMYQKDPAAALASVVRHLRPGGDANRNAGQSFALGISSSGIRNPGCGVHCCVVQEGAAIEVIRYRAGLRLQVAGRSGHIAGLQRSDQSGTL